MTRRKYTGQARPVPPRCVDHMIRILFFSLLAFAVLPPHVSGHGMGGQTAGIGGDLDVSRTLAGVACLVLAIGQAASLVIRALRGEPERTRY